MTSLKIGLVGCGKQAPKHISGLRMRPGVEIVLADQVPALAQELSAQHDVAWVPAVDDLLQDPALAAIDICTPTPTHHGLAKSALTKGKHIFCEKPLCQSLSEANELRTLAKAAGSIVQVGYIYRHAPAFKLARELMAGEDPALGRPVWGFFRIGGRGSHKSWKHMRRTGGGVINEMLVHMLDLACWYCGPLTGLEVVKHATIMKTRWIEGEEVKPDTEDFVALSATGREGMQVLIQADFVTPNFSQYVELQGENGSFMGSVVPSFDSFMHLRTARGGFEQGHTRLDFGETNFFESQMCAFVDAVNGDQDAASGSIEESIELMRMIEAVQQHIGATNA